MEMTHGQRHLLKCESTSVNENPRFERLSLHPGRWITWGEHSSVARHSYPRTRQNHVTNDIWNHDVQQSQFLPFLPALIKSITPDLPSLRWCERKTAHSVFQPRMVDESETGLPWHQWVDIIDPILLRCSGRHTLMTCRVTSMYISIALLVRKHFEKISSNRAVKCRSNQVNIHTYLTTNR
jgi:hypothetical protein